MDGANPLVDIAVTSNRLTFPSDIDFEYRSSASVYAVYPASGSTSGSTRVTVTGSNFQEGPGLTVGSVRWLYLRRGALKRAAGLRVAAYVIWYGGRGNYKR